jgi:hypothetical protein
MVHMSHTLGYPKNAAAQQVWEQEPPRRLQVEYDILKHSDALVAESPASKQHMVQEYGVDPARVQIIPCGGIRCCFVHRTAAGATCPGLA